MTSLLAAWFVATCFIQAVAADPPTPGSGAMDTVITPVRTMELSSWVTETSGLILWEGSLWTHNDDTDTRLYEIDTTTGAVAHMDLLRGGENYDWEDIAQDGAYIYLGDFGNNGTGTRMDLHILRIEKSSLKSGRPSIDTIWFSYSDQVDFNSPGLNNTDFDCEAFVVSSDSIYLFTKQWVSAGTALYSLPKEPGEYVAEKLATFRIGGMVTGATYLEKEHLLALCGYSGLIQPFIYLLYDYPGHHFFSGRSRRLNLSLLFHQVEGIATEDGLKYFISNEYSGLRSAGISYNQQIHVLDLEPFLKGYLDGD
jgi:hypothetical protein